MYKKYLILGVCTALLAGHSSSAINQPMIEHYLQPPLMPWPQQSYNSSAAWDMLKDRTVTTEKMFVIIVPSFNNEAWYERNLSSIFAQTYPHYRVVYCNDASTDKTGELVAAYVAANNQQHRVEIINRATNIGGLANMYTEIHRCAPHEIVMELDGDDWFKHPQVLDLLNKVYANPNIWLTFGHYEEFPSGNIDLHAMDLQRCVPTHNYRHSMGWCSPLRTFYAWLFMLIKKEDLCDNNGTMLRLSWDHAMMWPMCEMAAGRCMFIPDVLYVYNKQNPINDFKLYQAQQNAAASIVCRKPRYTPLPKDYTLNK